MDDSDDELTPRRERVTDSHQVMMPRTMFEAHLQRQNEELRSDVDSLLASRRFWRWAATLGIPAVLTAMFAFSLYYADKIEAGAERSGRTGAKIDDIEKLIENIQRDITDLRKHAGLDPKPITFDGRIGSLP